jgi:hypothetical protein
LLLALDGVFVSSGMGTGFLGLGGLTGFDFFGAPSLFFVLDFAI